jgi:hypothetical protein
MYLESFGKKTYFLSLRDEMYTMNSNVFSVTLICCGLKRTLQD